METITPKPEVKGYDPLKGRVVEKVYADTSSNFPQDKLYQDIAEPAFTPPPPDFEDIPIREGGAGPSSSKESTSSSNSQAQTTFNPQLENLPDSEKAKAAEKAAQAILNGYKGLHVIANGWLQISPKKINKLLMEGEIDLAVQVPYDTKNFVSLADFINETNEAVKEVLTVDPDFEKAILPPLTRVLAKKGHGMTDEMQLAFLAGQDILLKSYQFVSLKSTINQVIQFAKDQTAEGSFRRSAPNMYSPAPEQQPVSAEPMQQQQQQSEPLQDSILKQHQAASHGDTSGIPQLIGNQNRVNAIDKIYEEDLKTIRRKKRVREEVHGIAVPKRKKGTGGVPTAKRRGPKVGSTRRKNNPNLPPAGPINELPKL